MYIRGKANEETSMISLVRLATGTAPSFNEVLSVIYADGQKMNWHDDGEKGKWREGSQL